VSNGEEPPARRAEPGRWPGDPASPQTPVAHRAGEVAALAGAGTLAELTARQSVCRACPRLVAWREDVAETRRRAFRDEPYWGRPIPGWGAERPRVLIVGLAPAAHGGNRTGRVFTGDRSGDFLFAALHRARYANQSASTGIDDGLELTDAFITAAVRCAPPENKPTPVERDSCAHFLTEELAELGRTKVVLALGAFAYEAAAKVVLDGGTRRPRFAHGLEVATTGGKVLLCSYHPSQRNVFTGLLTPDMFDAILQRARDLSR
jgi:uracil-DNA glycosylase family 4